MTDRRLAEAVVLGLATYRLSRVIPLDDVAEPVRRRVQLWQLEGGSDSRGRRVALAKLVTCPDCSAVWIGLGLALLWQARAGRWLVTALAAAGLQVALARAVTINEVEAELKELEDELEGSVTWNVD